MAKLSKTQLFNRLEPHLKDFTLFETVEDKPQRSRTQRIRRFSNRLSFVSKIKLVMRKERIKAELETARKALRESVTKKQNGKKECSDFNSKNSIIRCSALSI